MGFLGIVPLRYWAYLGVFLALVGAGWTLHHRIDAAGYSRCHAEWDAAVREAKAKRDAELEVARIKGEILTKQLIEQQQKNKALSKEYLTYANAITGNCPGAVGVLSDAAATGVPLPPSASHPDAAAPPLSAADLAENIVTNYAIANSNAAQLNGLQRWIEEVLK